MKKQKQITQEFFPRSKSSKAGGMIFNKAPINRNEAYKETKAKVIDEQEDMEERRKNPKTVKGSFMANLYRDDDEFNELKVMGIVDEDDDEVKQARGEGLLKRKSKTIDKKQIKTAYSQKIDEAKSRIPKLLIRKGGLAMFAVCEIGDDYLIVNHTRNTKGYIPLAGSKLNRSQFKVGQYLTASITAEIGGANTGEIYNFASGKAGLNRKIQLSLDCVQINKNLTAASVTQSMIFQAIIESKEAKGYILDLGFRDNTKGFLKFSEDNFKKGDIITVIVKSVDQVSKVLKCESISESNCQDCVHQSDQVALTHMKPGFNVSGKVSKIYENGVEITFLGGITATCFVDHLQEDISEYKLGKKVIARIISVDTIAKKITVSMLNSIVNWNIHKPEYKIGETICKAKIAKKIYGGSFLVDFSNGSGFLHKTQTSEAKKEDQDSDEFVKKESIDFSVGQVLDEVKVKEINYFDSKPILSLRQSLIKAEAISYETIQVGQYFQAVIEKVVAEKNYVQLSINNFVKGNLHIEHMGDNAIKQIPPKFLEVGKDMRVRVLSVNVSKRSLEFTKKDTLMKDDAIVYQSYKQVKKGDKVVGVVVGQNQYGFVISTFGAIKGLLNFEDVEEKLGKGYDQNQFKVGSIVNAYVIFKKHDKGVALTLSKKKAKATLGESQDTADSIEKAYLPNDEEFEGILKNDKFSTMIKSTKDPFLIGSVNQFRVVEENDRYCIVKSLDAVKKSKNYIAILPKCFIGSVNTTEQNETNKGLVLDLMRGLIPIISIQPHLIALKDQILSKDQDQLPIGSTYIGVVNGIVAKSGAVGVRFLNGIQKLIKVKDLNTTQDYKKIYTLGKVIRVAVNKLGRLCTKAKVINASMGSIEEDQKVQTNCLIDQLVKNFKIMGLELGQEIETTVQLVKDYGIITQIEGQNAQTGFIINDHKGGQGKYKQGQTLKCVVLDVDPLKKIADLSEKTFKKSDKEIKVGSTCRAIVELNKDSYVICSFKNNRGKFGACIIQNFNHDDQVGHIGIGEEIDVKVIDIIQGIYQIIPDAKIVEKKSSAISRFELKEGIKFMGQIKSIKNCCMYIQVPTSKGIGRLHMVECPKFEQYTVGDKIEAKILKVTQERDRTWIELTRNPKHMAKAQGLNPEALNETLLQESDLKTGKKYEGVIVSSSWDSQEAINLKLSEPIHFQLSPFLRGKIPFNHIVPVNELQKFGPQVLEETNYKIGQRIEATYLGNGQFSLLENISDVKSFKRGQLVAVRYVNLVKGRGITVQLNTNSFGFIEVSEITDDITGNVFKFSQKKCVFAARVIDHDKNGKVQLSSRESVIDEESWNAIKPEGTTIKFQNFDKINQERGNLRNKILKFGASIAIQQGDLAIGYIVNIGKSGCFVQIGHNTVIRAGLNELSDDANFNFNHEMPIGSIVFGRVYRIDTQPNGEKKFHFSTRQSIVVYGALAVERKSLQVGQQVESIVMAVADGKVFSQIKGSYVKIKVKGCNQSDNLSVGDHVFSTLQKVTKEKISSQYIGRSGASGEKPDMSAEERQAQNIYFSVKEEAQKDIESIRGINSHNGVDFDHSHIDQRNFLDKEAQIAQQIQDLNELDQDLSEEDSDAEEMKRMITYDDNDEEMEDEESGEYESDQEMESSEPKDKDDNSSDESASDRPKKAKKRTLKERLKEEQQIRDKEQRMRSGDDKPQDIDDFERLLVSNQDQSYLWIQYMAFMLDNVGVDAARKVVERGVKAVGISNDEEKLNLWTAFMNLESNFGTQQTLEACTRRALEVNDRKKVYNNLIDIYKTSMKFGYVEVIYKQLCKKFGNSLDIWTAYIEFLIEMKHKMEDETQKFVLDTEFSDPKTVLQKSLQALSKDQHVAMISKYGMLEFKYGQPENGRTMFEGIVSNYPKRMDIWSIYMDMELKYGQGNVTQARHLFERCLNSEYIQKKPKKMKLVFQKYMEYENKLGNKNNLAKLKVRVEEYLTQFYGNNKSEGEDSDQE